MKILITGKPGIGKTTFIREIISATQAEWSGFYTQHILEDKKRIGFRIITMEGDTGILAHVKYPGKKSVGKYKVNINDLEKVAVRSVENAIMDKRPVVIDEIGKMEILSDSFRRIVQIVLNSNLPLIGSIALANEVFFNNIRKREDVMVVELTDDNRRILRTMILDMMKKDGILLV
ncbi:MAG: NTPase [candidate division KSB1 bacterium]|jgi:nucleoside-triphosphatase|nr:NTPase [candidate division KSB1 bacterium]